ncbi:N-acetyl-gamma-glutamyl-phosphate reductase [Clostridium gasigenes]|uniref:N-acetyl-gamma-glutamyl-phosphate reductase n=1 Tax=Clostridium gasigenes TaxID=94869 RepID=UPI0014385C85|nr:N-acetyl-gamma-glutamyl-phosphate reductase [Clostridium gasigenes]NKF07526.1 N-acetyl-gamma-glutamyl-phosphate reductase [Clostridium gasigenes]QSW17962.1 N-acetyl-gamma-glutamyl-phosphate reductase [Clostridium gasigenes]
MFKVGIIGATGYVGCELLRILINHPSVEVSAISSISFEGEEFSSIYKSFYKMTDLICENKSDVIEKCEVIFTALPHGLSEDIANECLAANKICIDLGADFRLTSEDEYKKWYGKEFSHKELHSKSIYGLPELNRDKIKTCKIIANPGCYPTSIELGLLPLLKNSLIDGKNIICDSKSGVTGAGRGLSQKTHAAQLNGDFAPYAVGSHRHIPEIEEILGTIANEKINVTFTPHLLPINRGIISTIYTTPKKELMSYKFNSNIDISQKISSDKITYKEIKSDKIDLEEIYKLYCETYKNEPFTHVLPIGETASIKNVAFTNNCHISLHLNHRCDGIIVVSAIDNMIKGAAGQAIQNMNIILGINETEGLNFIAPAF